MTSDFNRMLISNAESLKPFAITLTKDTEAANDLYQETLCRALLNSDKYNIGTNIRAWLYTIMRNIFINNYRRTVKQKYMFNDEHVKIKQDAKSINANEALYSLNAKEIQKAVLALPVIFKQPFLLYTEGYMYNEIAAMLNEPLGTIKSRIHFARKLLKAQVERF